MSDVYRRAVSHVTHTRAAVMLESQGNALRVRAERRQVDPQARPVGLELALRR